MCLKGELLVKGYKIPVKEEEKIQNVYYVTWGFIINKNVTCSGKFPKKKVNFRFSHHRKMISM
jgi:hypothetical protein